MKKLILIILVAAVAGGCMFKGASAKVEGAHAKRAAMMANI